MTSIDDQIQILKDRLQFDASINKIKARPLTRQVNNTFTIDLSDLGISQLPKGSLADLRSVSSIIFNSNNINKLDSNVFDENTGITRLSFYDCGLNEIEDEFFTNLPDLQILILSNNNLEKLPKSLSHLNYLKELRLSNNLLKELPEQLPIRWFSLKVLDISNNEIVEIPVTLSMCFNLETLNTVNNPCHNPKLNTKNKIGTQAFLNELRQKLDNDSFDDLDSLLVDLISVRPNLDESNPFEQVFIKALLAGKEKEGTGNSQIHSVINDRRCCQLHGRLGDQYCNICGRVIPDEYLLKD